MTSSSSWNSTISRKTSPSGSRPTTRQRPFGCNRQDSAYSSAWRRTANGTQRRSINPTRDSPPGFGRCAREIGFGASPPSPSLLNLESTRHFVKYGRYVYIFLDKIWTRSVVAGPAKSNGSENQGVTRFVRDREWCPDAITNSLCVKCVRVSRLVNTAENDRHLDHGPRSHLDDEFKRSGGHPLLHAANCGLGVPRSRVSAYRATRTVEPQGRLASFTRRCA
jgi:hypothetical protein